MSSSQEHVDQRKSYRCRVPDGQEYAELQVGRRRMPIRLFNESAGGFAALMEGNPRIKVDDVVELITDMGRFETRVAYVSQLVQASSGRKQAAPLLRIGLERVRDLSPSSRWAARPGYTSAGRATTIVFAVVGAALAAVAVFFGARALQPDPNGPLPPQTHVPAGTLAVTGRAAEPTPAKTLSQIGLSDAQQQQIEAAAAMAAETFRELDGQWNNDSPGQRARKQAMVWKAARREILDRLTDEQRKRWKQSFE